MSTSPACTATPKSRRRSLLSTAVATGLLLAMTPAGAASAAPVVTGGPAASYTEQAAPALIGTGVTIAGGGSYAGQYVEFAVGSAAASEVLSLAADASPVVTAGVASIVGGSVYLGNGTTADPVGSIDAVRNGTGGQPLRVNFTSAFANSGFESANLTGWTAINSRIDLGVTAINGIVPTDTSTYPPQTGAQDNRVPTVAGTYTSTVQSSASEGAYALQLTSRSITTAVGYDVVHGPAVYTAPFEAAAGDKIYFDWRAFAGDDNYHVFGYVVDAGGVQTEVLDSTGPGTTLWASQETVIPTAGTYRFVFVAGTFDASGGRAAGASLQIDNVRVYGNRATDDIAQQVARKLQYANSSDVPPASRTVSITAASSANGTATGSIVVNITPVDDAPVMGATSSPTYVNSEGTQTYPDTTGTLTASDPEGDAFTFGISGGTAQAATVGGSTYTDALVGTYGTLRVNATTGAYVYVPNATAIDGRLTDDTDSFTVTSTSNGLTSTTPYTVVLDVPASAPGAPTGLAATAGPEQVSLAWTAPEWLGGSDITSYLIESSTDGVLWTVVTDTGTAGTTATVTGLTNGVPVSFRVSATNVTGTGAPSGTASATPVDVADAPTDLTALPGNGTADLAWTAPADTGGTPVTGYRIESSTDGSTWTQVTDTAAAASSYTATGLTNGAPVTFRVSALNAVGTGPASTPATTTPRTVPDAPAPVEAVAGVESVELTWGAPVDDGGADVTGYRIESSTDGTTWTTVVADTASTGTSHTVTGLTNGTTTSFRVAAINAAGAGAFGQVVEATPRRTPDAPAITGVVGGNRTLSVSFTPPTDDGGADLLTYEFSLDGGVTWTARKYGTVGSPVVIGGLVNGAGYTVLLRAVNEAGPGPASALATGSPVLQPILAPGTLGPVMPALPAGGSLYLVDGLVRPAEVSTATGAWFVTGAGFTAGLRGVGPDGAVLALDSSGRIVVTVGGAVQATGTGFRPGSSVDVWLLGTTPVLLGEVTVRADGTFDQRFALPAGLVAGNHTVQLNGVSTTGDVRSLSTGLLVAATRTPAVSPALARTGSDVTTMSLLVGLLLVTGATAVTGVRLRRARSAG